MQRLVLEFAGVPVPDASEALFIEVAQQERYRLRDHRGPIVDQLAQKVLESSAYLDEVIAMDGEVEASIPAGYSPEQADLYKDGIEFGYLFMIGALSYTQYLRNGYDSVDEFEAALEAGEVIVPAQTAAVAERMQQVFSGEAPVDQVSVERGASDSSQLSTIEAERFFAIAPELKQIRDDQVQRVKDIVAKHGDSMEENFEGILHGIDSALLLYVESHAESVLASLSY
jgi:hypothetical protein